MKVPFNCITLYRKEHSLDEMLNRNSCIDDFYDDYKVVIDLEDITVIEEGFLKGICVVSIKGREKNMILKIDFIKLDKILRERIQAYNLSALFVNKI